MAPTPRSSISPCSRRERYYWVLSAYKRLRVSKRVWRKTYPEDWKRRFDSNVSGFPWCIVMLLVRTTRAGYKIEWPEAITIIRKLTFLQCRGSIQGGTSFLPGYGTTIHMKGHEKYGQLHLATDEEALSHWVFTDLYRREPALFAECSPHHVRWEYDKCNLPAQIDIEGWKVWSTSSSA